ncbi:ribonuclease [Starmerella bacillaris]|uniref:Endonuclease n=1 Tax=Starmerella bacillaris TaxID=1247836 RepID=A0AAV5RMK4_STABA|nr:ribonuclease [Starmerella bacillaris]
MGIWSHLFGGKDTPSDTVTPKGSSTVKSTSSSNKIVAPQTPVESERRIDTSPVNPAEYFKLYGYPIPIHDLETRSEFVSCYDRRFKSPNWVIEHLTTQSRDINNANRKNSFFKEDTVIPEMFRARLQDYFRSGYDRGHQAPAANAKFSQTAMDETFYLTNIAPQVGAGFNRDYWAHFERFSRNLTKTYSSVRVITGPLFLPKQIPGTNKSVVTYEVIGNPPTIAVPTHFFKILIGESPISPKLPKNGVAIGAFVLPNDVIDNRVPLESFQVPLDAIERSAGVEFMPKLPQNSRRELCKEVTCAIEVVEFIEGVRQVKQLPPPK